MPQEHSVSTAQRSAKIISFINLKGGVGKTTLCLTIGEILAFAKNKKVLLIDLDSQSNLTSSIVSEQFLIEYENKGSSVYHLFKNLLPPSKEDTQKKQETFKSWDLKTAIVPPEKCSNIYNNMNLSAILSLPALGSFDEDLADALADCREGKNTSLSINIKVKEWRKLLKNRLEGLRSQYDYILIDCPPSLSLFTSNALVASDYFVTPIAPEFLSIKGLELIHKRLGTLIARPELKGVKVEFAGCMVNKIDIRRGDHKSLCEGKIYGNDKGKFKPFTYWIGDLKPMYIVTDFVYPYNKKLRKWNTVEEKYNIGYKYKNPPGKLHIPLEDDRYNLYIRLCHLAEEFIQRCK